MRFRACLAAGTVLLASVAIASAQSVAQDDSDQEDLEATLAALQTEVAAIETEIAEEESRDGTPGNGDPEVSTSSAPALVFGPAVDALPEGEPGELSIIVRSEFDNDSQRLYFVLRNGTDDHLLNASVTAVARDSEGDLWATGDSLLVYPNSIEPGGVAFGYVYVDASLPEDAEFELSAQATPADEAMFEFLLDVVIISADFIDDRIVGEVRNDNDEAIGLASVEAMCFDDEGLPIGSFSGSISGDGLPSGEVGVFQISLYGGIDCTNFLIAGFGLSG